MQLFIDKTYTSIDFRNQGISKGEYDNCKFIDCKFQELHISNTSFLECSFEDCDFSNTNWGGTVLNDVLFKNSKLIGSDFSVCNPFMLKIRFRESNLDYINFCRLPLSNTLFDGCTLKSADFTESNLSNVFFKNCDLTDSIFLQSNLLRTDFSTALNFNIDPNQNEIKGAYFSLEGLPGLLKKYGINIS